MVKFHHASNIPSSSCMFSLWTNEGSTLDSDWLLHIHVLMLLVTFFTFKLELSYFFVNYHVFILQWLLYHNNCCVLWMKDSTKMYVIDIREYVVKIKPKQKKTKGSWSRCFHFTSAYILRPTKSQGTKCHLYLYSLLHILKLDSLELLASFFPTI